MSSFAHLHCCPLQSSSTSPRPTQPHAKSDLITSSYANPSRCIKARGRVSSIPSRFAELSAIALACFDRAADLYKTDGTPLGLDGMPQPISENMGVINHLKQDCISTFLSPRSPPIYHSRAASPTLSFPGHATPTA